MKRCSVDGCETQVQARGWCCTHYGRWQRHGDPTVTLKPLDRTCTAEGCGRKHDANGWCSMHGRRKTPGGDKSTHRKHQRCTIEGCGRPHDSNGLCSQHVARLRRHGDVLADLPIGARPPLCQFQDGYRIVRAPEAHPNARANGTIFEHRLVMSQKLARALLPGESVHHLNGDRADNRPENLELWVNASRMGQRVEDVVAHCVATLTRYAPELLK